MEDHAKHKQVKWWGWSKLRGVNDVARPCGPHGPSDRVNTGFIPGHPESYSRIASLTYQPQRESIRMHWPVFVQQGFINFNSVGYVLGVSLLKNKNGICRDLPLQWKQKMDEYMIGFCADVFSLVSCCSRETGSLTHNLPFWQSSFAFSSCRLRSWTSSFWWTQQRPCPCCHPKWIGIHCKRTDVLTLWLWSCRCFLATADAMASIFLAISGQGSSASRGDSGGSPPLAQGGRDLHEGSYRWALNDMDMLTVSSCSRISLVVDSTMLSWKEKSEDRVVRVGMVCVHSITRDLNKRSVVKSCLFGD